MIAETTSRQLIRLYLDNIQYEYSIEENSILFNNKIASQGFSKWLHDYFKIEMDSDAIMTVATFANTAKLLSQEVTTDENLLLLKMCKLYKVILDNTNITLRKQSEKYIKYTQILSDIINDINKDILNMDDDDE